MTKCVHNIAREIETTQTLSNPHKNYANLQRIAIPSPSCKIIRVLAKIFCVSTDLGPLFKFLKRMKRLQCYWDHTVPFRLHPLRKKKPYLMTVSDKAHTPPYLNRFRVRFCIGQKGYSVTETNLVLSDFTLDTSTQLY